MKREVFDLIQGDAVSGCCPGHDPFPNDTYANNRSKRRRAKDIKREHKYVRRKKKQFLNRDPAEQA